MILDEFIIQFKSNAKQTQTDVASLDKQIDALAAKGKKRTDAEKQQLRDLVKLRSESTQDIKDQSKATDNLGDSLLDLGAKAIIGFSAFSFLKSGVSNAIDLNYQLEKQQRLFGLNASEINAYDAAFVQGGAARGEFLSWISNYAQFLQNAGLGDRIKNIIPDLRNLADQMQKMDPNAAQALGARAGLTPDIVLTLRQGGAALDDMVAKQEKLAQITDQSTKAAREFKNEWSTTLNEISGSFSELLVVLSPILTPLLKLFNFIHAPLPVPPILGGPTPKKPSQDIATSQDQTVFNAVPPSSGTAPRGIRNNNPGNLVRWPGAGSDGQFAVFNTMGAGISAEQANLRIYGRRGYDTLDKIIRKWAPPNENDTAAYIAAASRSTGFAPDQKLDMNNPDVIRKVANAINAHENGSNFGALIGAAQDNIAAADSSRFNSTPGTSVSNQKNLSIGSLTIQTQATDAAGIAAAVHTELAQQYQTVIGNYDDGVAR